MICDMTDQPEHPEAIAESATQRVVEGFVVPERGPLFKAELRWEADLALGRILACLKAELSLAEAAEVFEAWFKALSKVRKRRGRPKSLSEIEEQRYLDLSDDLPVKVVASMLADELGFLEGARDDRAKD